MTPAATTYPQWKAPVQDGATFIWPKPADLLAQTRDNHQRLPKESRVLIQNVPLPEVRDRLRKWIGAGDEPVIATGHQTELFHSGVWAKNALINTIAAKLSGSAYYFAVDTDAPKHLSVRWPGRSIPITDDPSLATARWCGLLEGPTPRHLQELRSTLTIAATDWPFKPAIEPFLDSMRMLSLEQPKLSPQIVNAMHQLDWSLGLRHHALVCSPMWVCEPFLLFVHHILSHAAEFSRDYNAALADYRRANRMRTASRPMPDLRISADECEVPFWLDELSSGHRRRASVARSGAGWKLTLGGEDFVFSPVTDGWQAAGQLLQFLRHHDARLSPRALTLTLALRLLLVDQFIHGIGGARYDQVTDSLIASHFNIEPPKFAVTTATLLFPTAVDRPRACVPCLAHEGHALRHRVLGERKMDFIEQISGLPRRSSQRRRVFAQMHQELSTAMAGNPTLHQWDDRYRKALRDSADEQSLFDRELFYAIQPHERLTGVIEQYEAAFR